MERKRKKERKKEKKKKEKRKRKEKKPFSTIKCSWLKEPWRKMKNKNRGKVCSKTEKFSPNVCDGTLEDCFLSSFCPLLSCHLCLHCSNLGESKKKRKGKERREEKKRKEKVVVSVAVGCPFFHHSNLGLIPQKSHRRHHLAQFRSPIPIWNIQWFLFVRWVGIDTRKIVQSPHFVRVLWIKSKLEEKKKAIGFASIRPRKWEDKEINVE